MALELEAPAKLNLSLRIVGRRADGYHELDTLMARVSVADRVRVELGGDGIRLSCSDASVPADDSNLAWKAARLACEGAGWTGGVRVVLEKRIPAGAGLGGASADAAAVLFAVNQLCGCPMGTAALRGLAAQLGSDVPFFLGATVARCTGRGEVVEAAAVAGLPARVVVVTPPFGVSTPAAYGAYAAAGAEGKRGEVRGEFAWGSMVNDLEPVVFGKYPVLAGMRDWLAARPGVAGAAMSGSGSSLYAVLEEGAVTEGWAGEFAARFGVPRLFATAGVG